MQREISGRSKSMNTLSGAVLEVDNDSLIEVREVNGFKGVFAMSHIVESSVIFQLKGTISTQPTKYTIQLGSNEHLTFPAIRRKNDDLDYCWQYLNHCCEPNGYVDVDERTFRALRNIEQGEEITFNYLATETVMADPFNCICGSPRCFGFIRGRDFLTRSQLRRLFTTTFRLNRTLSAGPFLRRSFLNLQDSVSS
jgi:SET domain